MSALTRPLGLNTSQSPSYSCGVCGAEPLIELEIDDTDAQVERLRLRVVDSERSVGAHDCQAVRTAGVGDGHRPVLDADHSGQVVDRKRQFGALPNPVVEPDERLIDQAVPGRGRRIVTESI